MSAREVIRLIEALPLSKQRKVVAFVDSSKSKLTGEKPANRMSFKDAKKHVFTIYGDVLEKLAK